MRLTCGALLFIAAAILGVRAEAASLPEDACVAFHRRLTRVPTLEHTVEDWERSPHARAEVSCAACHRGRPDQEGAASAHAGVISSTMPASATYYTVLPETCGACHARELAAFSRSVHADFLKRTGRGPSCVACHGAMANYLIAPRDLEMTCALCHRSPTQAYAARLAVASAAAAVAALEARPGAAPRRACARA